MGTTAISFFIGIVVIVFGYIRWTSFESILVRGFNNGIDWIAISIFLFGGILVIYSIIMGSYESFESHNEKPKKNQFCRNCKGLNDIDNEFCQHCGNNLSNLIDHATPVEKNITSIGNSSVADQIKQILILKNSGELSEEEYLRAKEKILK